MFSRSTRQFSGALLIWSTLVATTFGGASMTVTDLKGRSLAIELISLAGDSVTFRRQGDPKEFTLPIGNFDGTSQELIRKESSSLPAVLPKIQPDVVIGKRRRKDNSYYRVIQDVTCTVKLSNLSNTLQVPALKGTIVFIGQDQRTPEVLSVLSSQSFEFSMKPGESLSKEMEPFFTTYDSDNKGVGNVGGFQYFGYILVLTDASGNVVLDDTTTGSIRQAIKERPAVIKEVISYPKGKQLTERLTPLRNGAVLRVPN